MDSFALRLVVTHTAGCLCSGLGWLCVFGRKVVTGVAVLGERPMGSQFNVSLCWCDIIEHIGRLTSLPSLVVY